MLIKIFYGNLCRFHKEINPQDYQILDSLTDYTVNYFKDKVEPNKKFKKQTQKKKKL